MFANLTSSRTGRRLSLPGALLAWLLVIGSGFASLLTYQMRAGVPAVAPGAWPSGAGLRLDPQRYNLVMFAHPKCPCTDASLEELRIVLAQDGGLISPTICFIDPAGVPAGWAQTGLVRKARGIPGLNVVIDVDGEMAGKFGAMTSGQVLMYDGKGRRIFAGGITGSRGHTGENRGFASVRALVSGDTNEPVQTPVFGCALHDEFCGTMKAP